MLIAEKQQPTKQIIVQVPPPTPVFSMLECPRKSKQRMPARAATVRMETTAAHAREQAAQNQSHSPPLRTLHKAHRARGKTRSTTPQRAAQKAAGLEPGNICSPIAAAQLITYYTRAREHENTQARPIPGRTASQCHVPATHTAARRQCSREPGWCRAARQPCGAGAHPLAAGGRRRR